MSSCSRLLCSLSAAAFCLSASFAAAQSSGSTSPGAASPGASSPSTPPASGVTRPDGADSGIGSRRGSGVGDPQTGSTDRMDNGRIQDNRADDNRLEEERERRTRNLPGSPPVTPRTTTPDGTSGPNR